ncbi:MAG: alpha/beta hydrolase [Bdellovibrionota bacterium]
MAQHILYYATNRGHEGADRWHPKRYGKNFSADGRENLRFGKLTVPVDEARIRAFLREKIGKEGTGNGEALSEYLAKCLPKGKIEAFQEGKIDPNLTDDQQLNKLGSLGFFSELKGQMIKSTDVLVFVHGYNVNWEDAAASALALQCMASQGEADNFEKILVVLFSWPSDGSMFPYRAYAADRADARDSGHAVGRAFLKLRDFLANLREEARLGNTKLCEQEMHLLCHSMGNFVLQNALARLAEYHPGDQLPRLFENAFLCAADVDDRVLQEGEALSRLPEISRGVSVYYNKYDKALLISDKTKGNPDRLGTNGAAKPYQLHNKIHQIDCTPVVAQGFTEHSYYLSGKVNADIRQTLAGIPQEDAKTRSREATGELPNLWRMK